jgi:hypothetical protein
MPAGNLLNVAARPDRALSTRARAGNLDRWQVPSPLPALRRAWLQTRPDAPGRPRLTGESEESQPAAHMHQAAGWKWKRRAKQPRPRHTTVFDALDGVGAKPLPSSPEQLSFVRSWTIEGVEAIRSIGDPSCRPKIPEGSNIVNMITDKCNPGTLA